MSNLNNSLKDGFPSQPVAPTKGIMASMKMDPNGLFMLGSDGVLRSFDGPFTRNVIDAVALSPAQLKQFLDHTEWTQETEDRFRGVDGRKVVGHEALFHPPDEQRPKKQTEEEVRKGALEVAEQHKKVAEEWAQMKRDGVDMKQKLVTRAYDLEPKTC